MPRGGAGGSPGRGLLRRKLSRCFGPSVLHDEDKPDGLIAPPDDVKLASGKNPRRGATGQPGTQPTAGKQADPVAAGAVQRQRSSGAAPLDSGRTGKPKLVSSNILAKLASGSGAAGDPRQQRTNGPEGAIQQPLPQANLVAGAYQALQRAGSSITDASPTLTRSGEGGSSASGAAAEPEAPTAAVPPVVSLQTPRDGDSSAPGPHAPKKLSEGEPSGILGA